MDKGRVTTTVVAGVLLAAAALIAQTPAQTPYDVKAHYVKREVYIPMRDGVKLFTIVYSPKETTARYPILMTRTAYGIGPYGAENYRTVLGPNNDFAKESYVFVYQDTRGKFKSEGEFIHHVPYARGATKPNESTDTWQTMCRPTRITWRTARTTSTGRRATCRRISRTSTTRCSSSPPGSTRRISTARSACTAR